jgi:hypothetical protein
VRLIRAERANSTGARTRGGLVNLNIPPEALELRIPDPDEPAEDDGAAIDIDAPGDAGGLVWAPRLRNRLGAMWLTARRWGAAKEDQVAWLRHSKHVSDPSVLHAAASDIVRLVEAMYAPKGWMVASVACGHSKRPDCFAARLGDQVAERLGLERRKCWEDRYVSGSSHPRENARLPALVFASDLPSGTVLVVDDVSTSGFHIHEALSGLRSRGVCALGVTWVDGSDSRRHSGVT